MDEVNISESASPSTSTIALHLVSNDTNAPSCTDEPSCIDIEVDVELNPIQPVSPFSSRASTDIESFDGENSVSAQLSPLLAFTPSENFVQHQIVQHQINWPIVIKVLAGVTLSFIVVLLTTFSFITKRGKANLGCQINFTVSKDGTSNFTTVSEAVKASPSYSPYKVCIFIRMGEYHEIVKIGNEKINLVLMGQGIGNTTISSNASIDELVTSSPLATLMIHGKEFLAQDLTIINTAHDGVAVDNLAENTIFFRCKLEGVNATLHIKGEKQLYRSCQLYGRSNLVFGEARAFFQKCDFLCEKSFPEEKIVFSSQSSHFSAYRSGFVFQLCAFYVVDKFQSSSETTFLSSSLGKYAFFVVMQSYLDASIGGYYLGASPPNTTYYAVFGNVGRGAAMAKMPPFVHLLGDVEAASQFSLRVFLGGDNWIPPWVEYDLDLLE